MPNTPWDTIPNFGANPTLWSVRNGQWHDSGTWSGGRVPTPTDVIVYDHLLVNHGAAEAKTVQGNPGGELVFNPAVDTSLTIANLIVLGKMKVGTVGNPIAASASIIFRDSPLDPVLDPQQYGNGMIVLGEFSACGLLERTPFVRLEIEPISGTSTLILADQAWNWQVGDKLLLVDSRQLRFPGAAYVPWWETVTIQSINPSGLVVTLTAPILYHHKGWRHSNGALGNMPHVLNMTRNVSIKSANMNGTRGHTLYTHRANVEIRRCKFGGLGRTLNVGPSQMGRYPVHPHHLMGRTTPQANGYQYTLEDNLVTCPLDPMPWRWGIVLHDSHYGKITGNIVHNVAGAGIVTEEGGESFNVIEGNFVCRVSGSGNRDNRGAAGDGFWFAGQNNYVQGNVACDLQGKATASTAAAYGYNLDCRTDQPNDTVRIPNFQGADTSVLGEYTLKKTREIPILEFLDNEVYCAPSGCTIWHVGADASNVVPNVQPNLVENLTVWHVSQFGMWNYQNAGLTIKNPVLHNDLAAIPGPNASTGIYGADYLHGGNPRIVGGEIRGFGTGWNPSTRCDGTEQVMEGTTIQCVQDVFIDRLWANNAGILPLLQPRVVRIKDVKHEVVPGQTHKSIVMNYSAAPAVNHAVLNTLFVEDYNGVVGDNFQVFMPTQQAAGFTCPKTATTTPPNIIGHPGAGVLAAV